MHKDQRIFPGLIFEMLFKSITTIEQNLYFIALTHYVTTSITVNHIIFLMNARISMEHFYLSNTYVENHKLKH